MQSLQINGEIRLAINGDENRVIAFNPSDVMFAERFYKLINEFQKTLTQYQARSAELDANTATDERGIPVNTPEKLEFIKGVCIYIREQIDALFGAGTSQTVFGDAMSIDAFTQFFEGITPFIQTARSQKLQKYTNKKVRK